MSQLYSVTRSRATGLHFLHRAYQNKTQVPWANRINCDVSYISEAKCLGSLATSLLLRVCVCECVQVSGWKGCL